jgi:two-component system sensor histidine kinase/response regulator
MRRAFWRNWPLAVQLTLAMAALVAISVSAVTVIYVNHEQANMRHELQKQAEVILVTLATTQADALYTLDTTGLKIAMENLGAAQADVHARIYDDGGRLIADSTQEQALIFAVEADPFAQELIASRDLIQRWNPGYLEIGRAVVVGRQPVGAIGLQISTTQLETQLQTARNEGLLLAGVATVLGIGISLLLSRTITRPLQQISTVAQRISGGNFSTRATVTGQNEIGHLAVTFNSMLDTIQKRDTEREQLVKELQTAKRLADENSRLKSEFLATMSHELRTPLNAVEGFTSIMLAGMGIELEPKARTMVERIQANSKRLLTLINDFLDLSRIESGRLELVSEPLSPIELAQKWKTEIAGLAEKKNLEFQIDLDPGLPDVVYGDEEALSKIAINLLGNAIKFTHEGRVTLALKSNGNTWAIVVGDTGIGIPPHAREFIFEEFRQVDGSSKRDYGGTGLGLAITQKIARVMGGTITLDSEVGRGSVFTVTVPLKNGHS